MLPKEHFDPKIVGVLFLGPSEFVARGLIVPRNNLWSYVALRLARRTPTHQMQKAVAAERLPILKSAIEDGFLFVYVCKMHNFTFS